MVNVLHLNILGGQYSWYQMWYLNLLRTWWLSLIFKEANKLDIRCDIKTFWLIGEYHWYSERPILLISDVISNLIWLLGEYHWYSRRPILLILDVISNLFEYLVNILCWYFGRLILLISNVISKWWIFSDQRYP